MAILQDVFRDVTKEDLQALLPECSCNPHEDPAFKVLPLGRSPDEPEPSDAAPALTLARSRANQAALVGGDAARTPGSPAGSSADEVSGASVADDAPRCNNFISVLTRIMATSQRSGLINALGYSTLGTPAYDVYQRITRMQICRTSIHSGANNETASLGWCATRCDAV